MVFVYNVEYYFNIRLVSEQSLSQVWRDLRGDGSKDFEGKASVNIRPGEDITRIPTFTKLLEVVVQLRILTSSLQVTDQEMFFNDLLWSKGKTTTFNFTVI